MGVTTVCIPRDYNYLTMGVITVCIHMDYNKLTIGLITCRSRGSYQADHGQPL